MFINEKILKRLMVKAFKTNGLYMNKMNGWYMLKGSGWEAKIAEGCIGKEILSVIIKCSGAIPAEGEAWTADTEKLQLEAFDQWPALPRPDVADAVEVTPCAVLSPGGVIYRILQHAEGGAISFRNDFIEAVDPTRLDRANQETSLLGPFSDKYSGVFWQTNQAVWHVCAMTPNRCDELLDRLGKIGLGYDEIEE